MEDLCTDGDLEIDVDDADTDGRREEERTLLLERRDPREFDRTRAALRSNSSSLPDEDSESTSESSSDTNRRSSMRSLKLKPASLCKWPSTAFESTAVRSGSTLLPPMFSAIDSSGFRDTELLALRRETEVVRAALPGTMGKAFDRDELEAELRLRGGCEDDDA